MINKAILLAAACIVCAPAQAAISVDGVLDAAYGAAKSTVTYDVNAPMHNFGAPTGSSNAIGYSIWLASDATNVYGYLRTSGPGASAGSFANLYFDVHPGNGASPDVVYEITNGLGKILSDPNLSPIAVNFFSSASVIEFAMPKAYFGADGSMAYLRLSQSFGYSVAGAPATKTGLGGVLVGGPVPEPATWGMMLVGFGALGATMRRRQAASVAFA